MVIPLVNSIFNVYHLILLARVFMTWIPNLDPTHPVVQFLYGMTEPILRPIRKMLPSGVMLDFSPLIVFFLLPIVQQFVIRFLAGILY